MTNRRLATAVGTQVSHQCLVAVAMVNRFMFFPIKARDCASRSHLGPIVPSTAGGSCWPLGDCPHCHARPFTVVLIIYIVTFSFVQRITRKRTSCPVDQRTQRTVDSFATTPLCFGLYGAHLLNAAAPSYSYCALKFLYATTA